MLALLKMLEKTTTQKTTLRKKSRFFCLLSNVKTTKSTIVDNQYIKKLNVKYFGKMQDFGKKGRKYIERNFLKGEKSKNKC